MEYQMLVMNLFNDMFVFFNGTQPLGLEPLIDVYQEEPLLTAFLSRLDEAIKVPYNDVMKECYAFYKRYAGGDFTDEVWENIVKDIQDFNQKWQNSWCRGIILALLELLELEDKARKESQNQGNGPESSGQEPMEQNGEQGEALQDEDALLEEYPEDQEGVQQGMDLAA